MIEKQKDNDLVQLLTKGNVEAFDSLFEVYSPKLYGFALKYLKSESEAEELVQEVFVKLWEHRQSLKTDYSLKSYLFTVALNRIRKYFNKKAISLRYLESLRTENELIDFNLETSNDYENTLHQINIIVEQLPPRRREIFVKCKMDGKSSKEVASELNISSGTVDNQVSEALRYIRSQLDKENITLLLFLVLFLS